jgi:hypothetical protein
MEYKLISANLTSYCRLKRYSFPIQVVSWQRIATLRDSLRYWREMRRSGVLVQTDANSDTFLDVRVPTWQVLFSDVIDAIPEVTSPEQLYFPLEEHLTVGIYLRTSRNAPIAGGGRHSSGKSVFLYTLLCSILKTHPNANDCQIPCRLPSARLRVLWGLPQLVEGGSLPMQRKWQSCLGFHLQRIRTPWDLLINDKTRYWRLQLDCWRKTRSVIVIVDEFADLTTNFQADRRTISILRFENCPSGSTEGIHLVLCTQRPSPTCASNIKAQLNGRWLCCVNDAIASRWLLNDNGAERLQKHGDMLYKTESVWAGFKVLLHWRPEWNELFLRYA